MKTIIAVLSCIIFCTNINVFGDEPLINPENLKEENKISFIPEFGLQLGSSFSQFSGYGSLFTQSITPTLSWSPQKNLRINAGAIVTNFNAGSSTGFNTMAFESNSFGNSAFSNNLTSSLFFVSGSYDINSRLTISGAGYYDQNKASMMFYNQNQNFGNNDVKGMMLGFDYKVSDSFRFGAEININSGYNNFMMSPYNSSYMSPFNQGFHNQSLFRRHNDW